MQYWQCACPASSLALPTKHGVHTATPPAPVRNVPGGHARHIDEPEMLGSEERREGGREREGGRGREGEVGREGRGGEGEEGKEVGTIFVLASISLVTGGTLCGATDVRVLPVGAGLAR